MPASSASSTRLPPASMVSRTEAEVTEDLPLRAAHRLFEVQGDVRDGARRGARSRLCDLHGASCHRVRLRTATTARCGRQHPHQSRRAIPTHHACSAAARSAPTCTSTTWRRPICFCCSSRTRRSTARSTMSATRTTRSMQLAEMVKAVVGDHLDDRRRANRRSALVSCVFGKNSARTWIRAAAHDRRRRCRPCQTPFAEGSLPNPHERRALLQHQS